MKKKSCRMTDEEKKMHEKAVRIRRMTDTQIYDFIERTIEHAYNRGVEDGNKLQIKNKSLDRAESIKDFIEYLSGKTGSGNRIGRGTIIQLKKEFENAASIGLFD